MGPIELFNCNNMDANKLPRTGIYKGHSMKNVPSQGEMTIFHINYNNKGHQETQLPDGTYIHRWRYKGIWSPWRNEKGEEIGQYHESGDK